MTDSNGEGISLLILSALWPLVPLNVTWASLCLKADGFHLSKCSTTPAPHLARLVLRSRQPPLGHVQPANVMAGSPARCRFRPRRDADFIRRLQTHHIPVMKTYSVSGLQSDRDYNNLISSLLEWKMENAIL